MLLNLETHKPWAITATVPGSKLHLTLCVSFKRDLSLHLFAAFVIYNFLSLLYEYIGGESAIMADLHDKQIEYVNLFFF